MKALIISGSPKREGLCFDLSAAIKQGYIDGGCETETVYLDSIERCHVCSGGWGTCRSENKCAFGSDGFDEAHSKIKEADVYCFVTPVYWQECSEPLKAFIDRLRRCEFGTKGALAGKRALLAASAGGSGNGIIACLDQLSRFASHTNMRVFDLIGQNRWNASYKQKAAYEAAKAQAETEAERARAEQSGSQ
ncbi:MAG: flavodoxin family protein [Eubacteriaceae bacterium]|nr:flavodoxin family protein [Eubacteriaceae bacterium]